MILGLVVTTTLGSGSRSFLPRVPQNSIKDRSYFCNKWGEGHRRRSSEWAVCEGRDTRPLCSEPTSQGLGNVELAPNKYHIY